MTRTHQWLCEACRHWRKKHPRGKCTACSADTAINDDQACRLCWSQFITSGGRKGGIDLLKANRFGQQLSLANLRHASVGQHRGTRRKREEPPNAVHAPAFTPVTHRQLTLFPAARDLANGLAHGFPPPAEPRMAAFLDQLLTEHARKHGWSLTHTKRTRRGLAIALGLQDTPGAPLRATDILGLQGIGITTLRLLEVCAAAGLLEDDREPAVDKWFKTATAELPEQMRNELDSWYTIMLNGSSTPPRSKPRSETTTRLYLRWSLPALHSWAASGQTSLREITPEHVKDVLPPSGNPRAAMGQGLRCLFRVLKGHRVIFFNPIGPMRTGTHETRHPMPLASAQLRDAINSTNPAGAALTAIVAFHGLRSGQLRKLQLTDIHDGRLHLDQRTIPLAQPVRDRLSVWLAYRERHWPSTRNPHVFISRRTALDSAPVGVQWITTSMGMTVQQAREDRILYELHASGGDLRRICDMFGLSIAGANRYSTVLAHPGLQTVNATPSGHHHQHKASTGATS
ncbi:hypothetical protein HTS88_18730 [Pseudarthrobacter oxydans]|uniref:hypothetical protein n=1 Tax=Pseudarthrobacter oxydans TaxID=1671 RepID=UPI001572C095|nr:hypothetical protein [Pseudarthrobacter oxydans]NSX38422.1 hypothetical protein [Pseudarthrobacter oxydans]